MLGTDGYGRSDFRAALRGFFEVDRRYVALAALGALAADGELDVVQVQEAIELYDIDPDRPTPARA